MCFIDQETKNIFLFNKSLTLIIMDELIGIASIKMRGIALNFQNYLLDITFIFESKLTTEEENAMRKVITDIFREDEFIIFNREKKPVFIIKDVNLNLVIIPPIIKVNYEKPNMGWVYLRKEYL